MKLIYWLRLLVFNGRVRATKSERQETLDQIAARTTAEFLSRQIIELLKGVRDGVEPQTIIKTLRGQDFRLITSAKGVRVESGNPRVLAELNWLLAHRGLQTSLAQAAKLSFEPSSLQITPA